MVSPPKNVATHLAHRGGVNFKEQIKVRKRLLNGDVVDYSMSTWKEKYEEGLVGLCLAES